MASRRKRKGRGGTSGRAASPQRALVATHPGPTSDIVVASSAEAVARSRATAVATVGASPTLTAGAPVATLPGEVGWRAVFVLLAIVSTLTAGIHVLRRGARLPSAPPPAEEQVAELAAATFHGTVRPANEVRVTATAAGVVREIHVRVGHRVAVGAPLVTVDSPDAEAALARAETDALAAEEDVQGLESRLAAADPDAAALRADLAMASGRTALAQRRAEEVPLRQRQDSPERAAAVHAQVAARHRRVVELHRHGILSAQDLDESDAALRVATADLDAARAVTSRLSELGYAQANESRLRGLLGAAEQRREVADLGAALRRARARHAQADRDLQTARRRMDETTARATRDGVIVELPTRVGDQVVMGTPLARVAELDRLVVDVPVSARVINAIASGQRATVLLAGSGEALPAHVATVNPLPDGRLLHAVEVEFLNEARALLVGQSVEVRFLPG